MARNAAFGQRVAEPEMPEITSSSSGKPAPEAEIVAAYPDLEREDLAEAVRYAAEGVLPMK